MGKQHFAVFTTALTIATWPRRMWPVEAKARTAPTLGARPRSYRPAAWPHQVLALPRISMPEIVRAYGAHCQN